MEKCAKIVVEALSVSYVEWLLTWVDIRRYDVRTPKSSPSPAPQLLRASDALAKSVLSRCKLYVSSHNVKWGRLQGMTNEVKTDFSAVIRSCNGRKSLLPPIDGIVELCAIFVAAVLNIVLVDE